MTNNQPKRYSNAKQGILPICFLDFLDISDPVLVFDELMEEIDLEKYLMARLTRAEELDGPVFLADYDKNDRVSGERRLLPLQEESYAHMFFHYDKRGNLTQQYRNDVLKEKNQYDAKNRLTATTDGDGVEVGCRYGIQNEQRELFTAASRKQGKAAQAFVYNVRGQITGIKDGREAETGYTLDSWGRITAIRTAEGGQEKYAYDCAGNVTKSVDANGGVTHYAYNSQGKVCRITDQSGLSETVVFKHFCNTMFEKFTIYFVLQMVSLSCCTNAV